MARLKKVVKRSLWLALLSAMCLLALVRSNAAPGDPMEQLRAYSRPVEFDFVSWTVNALWVKIQQLALGTSDYLGETARKQVVVDYLQLELDILRKRAEINAVYSDPNTSDPLAASAAMRQALAQMTGQRALLQPLAESVVQYQLGLVLNDLGLTIAGQAIPPVLFHVTAPPYGLIISPRDHIEQIDDISISPDLTVDQLATLEEQVDRASNISSLAVPIGGIGLYPTMIMQTIDINTLAEIVSHEWTHNFLTLRPLGISYLSSPELRIINETTASIAGNEIGRLLVERFYPEYLPPPPAAEQTAPNTTPATPEPPAFDFRAEMHTTRVTVDAMLAQGQIDEAEKYMEQRRVVFWDNGYTWIRKINQAYFAFYGAYADQHGGAAGEDPVGAAVRALRSQSASLTAFLERISWIASFAQLKQVVGK